MESKSLSRDCNNPNPDPKMAFHFLRALLHIQQSAATTSFTGRRRRIKRAAYASMAYSSGARRAWSRALIHTLRRRRQRQQRARTAVALPRRIRVARPPRREVAAADQAQVLRKLVPGGTGMEYCMLLEETADYIRCLATQVQLMRNVVDSVTNS
ncbi:transcription factor IBH1-like [Canna indica]|uniref:Transcription factor IBH1-like n=1 Tax=Canna indica TaxID=4628 RepID=A0AAQ3QNY6_9LILI|nr:transcription factor IBH1-like [Canna indica]